MFGSWAARHTSGPCLWAVSEGRRVACGSGVWHTASPALVYVWRGAWRAALAGVRARSWAWHWAASALLQSPPSLHPCSCGQSQLSMGGQRVTRGAMRQEKGPRTPFLSQIRCWKQSPHLWTNSLRMWVGLLSRRWGPWATPCQKSRWPCRHSVCVQGLITVHFTPRKSAETLPWLRNPQGTDGRESEKSSLREQTLRGTVMTWWQNEEGVYKSIRPALL